MVSGGIQITAISFLSEKWYVVLTWDNTPQNTHFNRFRDRGFFVIVIVAVVSLLDSTYVLIVFFFLPVFIFLQHPFG
jgi:hypothetical protein